MIRSFFALSAFALLLSTPAQAVLGRTYQSFLASEYGQKLGFELRHEKRGELLVYVGAAQEMVTLQIKRNFVYYQRFTWLKNGIPQQEIDRQAAYIEFLCQATNIVPGTPEYEQMSASVQNGLPEFTLLGNYTVRWNDGAKTKDGKPYIEIFVK